MEISKDVLNTRRNITKDRIYLSTETIDQLCKNKITYVGTTVPSRKDLQIVLKTAKGRQVLSSEFMWKNYGPTVDAILPETKQKCLLNVSCTQWITSLTPISSQWCRLDIVNQMLRDYSCQPTSDSWVIVVFTFILDLEAVKARTIVKYKDQRLLSDYNRTQTHNNLVRKRTLNTRLSVRLWTKWLWVRVPLQSLKLQKSRMFRAKSSLTFRQL